MLKVRGRLSIAKNSGIGKHKRENSAENPSVPRSTVFTADWLTLEISFSLAMGLKLLVCLLVFCFFDVQFWASAAQFGPSGNLTYLNLVGSLEFADVFAPVRHSRGRLEKLSKLTEKLSRLKNETLKSLKRRKVGGDKNYTWPIKRVAEIEGDVVLGGLMMVHEREDKTICGPIMPQGGIQALECMLYTLDWINNQSDFLPGIKLGSYVLDDCDKDTYGLEQAVDFIKGKII
ncbi:hypothetical protein JTE90_028932 [Oedothorax gibbosus]|uniref:Receptor ligand binding region domain-containing protein n=1 Tax=Oedothorax gibbosus TaxID=931172 RepID=A0AAV6VIJ8_9ARAC|nr:hypothetical protein JTE90_028932 [Oedothorax gibbosus]